MFTFSLSRYLVLKREGDKVQNFRVLSMIKSIIIEIIGEEEEEEEEEEYNALEGGIKY